VLVRYRQYMALRIPLAATNLVSAQPKVSTKLTLAALQELISVAEAEEVLCQPCQPISETSGDAYLQNCKPNSLPNSPSSSRK